MCFVGPTRPAGQAVDQLTSAYSAKYNEEPTVSYFLSAHDAAALLFLAIEQAATQNADGTLHIGRQKMRDSLYADKPLKGVTGTLNCDQFGDCSKPFFEILRLDNPILGLSGLEENIMFPDTSGQ